MTPVTLNKVASAPFFATGRAADLISQAREMFAKRNLRGYSKLVWQLRSTGMAECKRLDKQAADSLRATATDEDRIKAARYEALHGKARKRYGARHSAALTRAGVRFGASLPNVGAAQVWGAK